MSDNTQTVVVEDRTISIGGWILMFILQSIPIVGFVMLIIWALDTSCRTRANYARAILILFVLGMVLGALLLGIAAAGAALQ